MGYLGEKPVDSCNSNVIRAYGFTSSLLENDSGLFGYRNV